MVVNFMFSPLISILGKTWEMNDALFMAFTSVAEAVPSLLGLSSTETATRLAARAIAVALLAAAICAIMRRRPEKPEGHFSQALFIIAAVFLLSPTQYPWYCIWLIPLLAIRPQRSLLFLTAVLPLYYLRFYFKARDNVDLFNNGVVWFEFVPIWCLIVADWYAARCRAPHSDAEAA